VYWKNRTKTNRKY